MHLNWADEMKGFISITVSLVSSPLIVSKNINWAAIISIVVNECWAIFPSKPLRDLQEKRMIQKWKKKKKYIKQLASCYFVMLLIKKIKTSENVKK